MITCFEYDKLRPEPALRQALERHYGDHGVPYYQLISRGVQFNQHVGILQIGRHTIEILPKIDRLKTADDPQQWRNVLIDMLRKTDHLDLKMTDNADLRLKPNSILDIYIARFIDEVAYLMRHGLAKSYRKTEGNRLALKGKLKFEAQMRHNLVHAERFYVTHSTYDPQNRFNTILRMTLALLAHICQDAHLHGRIGPLLLDFPEMPDLVLSEALFQRLPWSRKTEGYRTAIDIARLLLLNYHPDIRGGQDEVIALMFDMNQLWERYVLKILRHAAPEGWTVEGQSKAVFWQADGMPNAGLKPDILLHGPGRSIVLDTKWKVLEGNRPNDADLRQLFAYQHRWACAEGYLVYPHSALSLQRGHFERHPYELHLPKIHGHVLGVQVLATQGLNHQLGKEIWDEILNSRSTATGLAASPAGT